MTAMGNLALLSSATGGVFVPAASGRPPRTWLKKAALDRFYNHGPRTELMRPIPIRLIASETAPLIGSAGWLDERERGGWVGRLVPTKVDRPCGRPRALSCHDMPPAVLGRPPVFSWRLRNPHPEDAMSNVDSGEEPASPATCSRSRMTAAAAAPLAARRQGGEALAKANAVGGGLRASVAPAMTITRAPPTAAAVECTPSPARAEIGRQSETDGLRRRNDDGRRRKRAPQARAASAAQPAARYAPGGPFCRRQSRREPR